MGFNRVPHYYSRSIGSTVQYRGETLRYNTDSYSAERADYSVALHHPPEQRQEQTINLHYNYEKMYWSLSQVQMLVERKPIIEFNIRWLITHVL